MKCRLAIALLAISCLSGPGEASDQIPRFGNSGPLTLPNGEHFEMRLLYGEVFYAPARGRILVIDQNNRIVAKSRSSKSMSLVCTNTMCSGYDHAEDQVLDVDPGSFRPGPVVPGGQRPDLWATAEDSEQWGFKEREATFSDLLHGEVALAQEKAAGLLVVSIIGAVATFLVVVSITLCRSKSSSNFIIFAGIFSVIFATIGVLILGILALYIGAYFGLSFPTWIIGAASGVLSVVFATLAIRAVVHRIHRDVAA